MSRLLARRDFIGQPADRAVARGGHSFTRAEAAIGAPTATGSVFWDGIQTKGGPAKPGGADA